MKILKTLVVLAIFVFNINITYASSVDTVDDVDTQDIVTVDSDDFLDIDESNSNSGLDFLQNRLDRIEELLNVNNKSLDEEQYEELIGELGLQEEQKSILEEVQDMLETQIKNANDNIQKKQEDLDRLQLELKESQVENTDDKKTIDDLKSQINAINRDISGQNNKIRALENERSINEGKISSLNTDIAELEIYKDRYKKLIQESKIKQNTKTRNSFIFYFGALFIYGVIVYILNRYRSKYGDDNNVKKLNHIAIAQILLGIGFIFFSITYLLIIKPSLGVLLVIIAGSIIVSLKSIIMSFFSSFHIITNYKIDDRVKIGGDVGRIKSIGLISTTLTLLDEDTLSGIGRNLKIPNSEFLEKPVIYLYRNGLLERYIFKLDFSKLNIGYKDFLTQIDGIFNIKDETGNISRSKYYIYSNGSGHLDYEFTLYFRLDNIDKVVLIDTITDIIKNNTKKEDDKK